MQKSCWKPARDDPNDPLFEYPRIPRICGVLLLRLGKTEEDEEECAHVRGGFPALLRCGFENGRVCVSFLVVFANGSSHGLKLASLWCAYFPDSNCVWDRCCRRFLWLAFCRKREKLNYSTENLKARWTHPPTCALMHIMLVAPHTPTSAPASYPHTPPACPGLRIQNTSSPSFSPWFFAALHVEKLYHILLRVSKRHHHHHKTNTCLWVHFFRITFSVALS